jgi:nitrite reductase/ring-hydroxylating ferredoxin subunit
MPDVFVAKATQFPDGERRIVSHAGCEIGVFHWQGQVLCVRESLRASGGPACEGIMMHKVEDVIGPTAAGRDRNFQARNSFCLPLARYEYDLKTGECAADRSLKLKSFEVIRAGRISMSSQAEAIAPTTQLSDRTFKTCSRNPCALRRTRRERDGALPAFAPMR